jgi:hypothetical protein
MKASIVSLIAVLSMAGAMAEPADKAKAVRPTVKAAKPAGPQNGVDKAAEDEKLKMQMYMDRMQKAEQTQSNAMKKSSETSDSIIKNTK